MCPPPRSSSTPWRWKVHHSDGRGNRLERLHAQSRAGTCRRKTARLLGQENVTSPDKKLRKEAVEKLGNLGAASPEVLPALTSALHDADAQVRSEAVLALAKLGPNAKPAIHDLDALSQSDPDAKVRGYAAKALEKLR